MESGFERGLSNGGRKGEVSVGIHTEIRIEKRYALLGLCFLRSAPLVFSLASTNDVVLFETTSFGVASFNIYMNNVGGDRSPVTGDSLFIYY